VARSRKSAASNFDDDLGDAREDVDPEGGEPGDLEIEEDLSEEDLENLEFDDDIELDEEVIDEDIEADIESLDVKEDLEEEVEEEEEEEEVEEDEDREPTLDEILKERSGLVEIEGEEGDEEEGEEDDEEENDSLTRRVLLGEKAEIAEDEFVCKSCFLVKHRTQLADSRRQLCRDCI